MARLCPKSEMPSSGASPLSHNSVNQEGAAARQQVSTWLAGQSEHQTFAQVLMSGRRTLSKSPSQGSSSTDVGSSSGFSSSPFSTESDSPISFPIQSEQLPSPPAPQCRACGAPPNHSDEPVGTGLFWARMGTNAPVWVGNGLEGDESAWLLVLPKFPQSHDVASPNGVARTPQSPKDAVLLGPYCTVKNTFLDDEYVGADTMWTCQFGKRSRARSLGARP